MPEFIKEFMVGADKLTLVSIGSLFGWFVLAQFGKTILSVARKLCLATFTVTGVLLYVKLAGSIITIMDQLDVDIYMRKYLAQSKGTDWIDGFLWGMSIWIYVAFVLYLWRKESKIGAKKTKKPIKVEAQMEVD